MKSALWILLVLVCAGCSAFQAPADLYEPPNVPPGFTPQAVATLVISQPSPTLPVPTDLPSSALESPAPALTSLPPDAASFPDPASFTWDQAASGLEFPVGIHHAGDGSGRVFILSQAGLIYVLQNGSVLDEPFLDLTSLVSGPRPGSYSERGLLGLAFHPQYAENGFFFVNYTDLDGNTVIARFQVSDDPDRADPASELRLLGVEQPFANHNGGGLAFGPDGYLYIALGDGGSGGDPQGRAQSLNTLLGKLLRITVDEGTPYAIPADNPFMAGGGLVEIWAYGLRNPWRFAFDPLTGGLFIGDVGQGAWEEVNYLAAGSPGGANFGWDYREGLHAFEGQPPEGAQFVDPVAEYAHTEGCSVTGGVVVRDPRLPALQGVYLYGDYCTGKVWGLLQAEDGTWKSQQLLSVPANISAFGEGEDGRVYLADLQGTVFVLNPR